MRTPVNKLATRDWSDGSFQFWVFTRLTSSIDIAERTGAFSKASLKLNLKTAPHIQNCLATERREPFTLANRNYGIRLVALRRTHKIT